MAGLLSRNAEQKEREYRDLTGETARATADLARGLGLEEKRYCTVPYCMAFDLPQSGVQVQSLVKFCGR